MTTPLENAAAVELLRKSREAQGLVKMRLSLPRLSPGKEAGT